jgi:hypothetical protein
MEIHPIENLALSMTSCDILSGTNGTKFNLIAPNGSRKIIQN